MKTIQSTPVNRVLLTILASVLCLISTTAAQVSDVKPASKAEVLSLKFESKRMAREVSYQVILPVDYTKQEDKRYPVVYMLHGQGGNSGNWADNSDLAEVWSKYNFIYVMPNGGTGWYSDSMTVPDDKYESHLIDEFMPEIERRFRTLPDREHRVIVGLSMGGYGAVKFGLKYPEKFVLVGSFSGAIGAATVTARQFPNATGKLLDSVFGPEDGEFRKANDPFGLVRSLTPEKIKTLPFIYQSCGTEDFLIGNNREFLALLNEKRVPHEYRERPGGHTGSFWNQETRAFLEIADRMLKGNSSEFRVQSSEFRVE